MAEAGWLDVSVPIRSGMVHWPGDAPVAIAHLQDLERGDTHTLSAMSLGSHTGTHVDAPAHFLKGGGTVDQIPFDYLVGNARVLGIRDKESIKVAELEKFDIKRGERILFKTTNSKLWKYDKFEKRFVYISAEAAEYLASRRVKLVGVDYLSVGGYNREGGVPHKVLLGAGACLVEGLDLSNVTPGRYRLICLPLRLEKGDGAPARVIVRPVP